MQGFNSKFLKYLVMKKILMALCIVIACACSKTDPVVTPPPPTNINPTTPTPPVLDFSTKYTTNQNVAFSKALVLDGINPETLKIINSNSKIHLITSVANNQSTPFDFFQK